MINTYELYTLLRLKRYCTELKSGDNICIEIQTGEDTAVKLVVHVDQVIGCKLDKRYEYFSSVKEISHSL